MKREYAHWWRQAPRSYQLPIFVGRIPAAMAIKYGQDRVTCNSLNLDADANSWAKECDYTQISRVAFAVATHYRCARLHLQLRCEH